MKKYLCICCVLLGLSLVAACDTMDGDMADSQAIVTDSPVTYRGKWSYTAKSSSAVGADGIEESSTLSYDPMAGLFTLSPMPVKTLLAIGGKRDLPVASAEPYVLNPYQKGYGSTNTILGVVAQSYRFNFVDDQKIRTMQVDFRDNGELSIDRYTNSFILSLEVAGISIDGAYLEDLDRGVLILR